MCFLLIVFFLIVAAFVTDSGIFLTLPDPDSGPKELTPDRAVVIALSAQGDSVDGVACGESSLAAAIGSAIAAKNPEAVILEPDSSVKYARVLKVLEMAKAAGGTMFSISSRRDPVPVEIQEAPK